MPPRAGFSKRTHGWHAVSLVLQGGGPRSRRPGESAFDARVADCRVSAVRQTGRSDAGVRGCRIRAPGQLLAGARRGRVGHTIRAVAVPPPRVGGAAAARALRPPLVRHNAGHGGCATRERAPEEAGDGGFGAVGVEAYCPGIRRPPDSWGAPSWRPQPVPWIRPPFSTTGNASTPPLARAASSGRTVLLLALREASGPAPSLERRWMRVTSVQPSCLACLGDAGLPSGPRCDP